MRPQTTCKRADCLLIVGPLLMIATTDSESLSPGSNPGPAATKLLTPFLLMAKPANVLP